MKLSRARYDAYDAELMEYQKLDYKIQLRRLEIMTTNEDGERVGGSSGIISKIPEQLVIKFDEDLQLKLLECQKQTIDHLYAILPTTCKDLYNLHWKEQLEWDEIIEKGYYSKSSIYRKREYILYQFAILTNKI